MARVTMLKWVCFVVLIIGVSSAYAQQHISYFELSLQVSYLPSGSEIESETYIYQDKKIHYITERVTNTGKSKKRKLRSGLTMLRVAKMLDSLFERESFAVVPGFLLRDSVIAHSFWNKNTGLTDSMIIAYFNNSDTLKFDLGAMRTYYSRTGIPQRVNMPEAIDGVPYTFDLKVEYINGNSKHYRFEGNLAGTPLESNFKYWLAWYIANREDAFFQNYYVRQYLSNRNLEVVTRQFIRYVNEER